MTYEQECNQFITQLATNGLILDGDVIGVNEITQIARAKISILQGSEVNEKYIILYREGGNIKWNFLNQADQLAYELDPQQGWHYPQFAKRLVAPIQLVFQYPAFEIWFRLNNLPVCSEGGYVYLYCNIILPEHQAFVDALQGMIVVEYNPLT